MANTSMKNMKLQEDLQLRIYEYLLQQQNTLDSQEEFQRFEEMISPSLKKKVLNFIYERIIKDNLIFRDS